jgi:hypothetical protein
MQMQQWVDKAKVHQKLHQADAILASSFVITVV